MRTAVVTRLPWIKRQQAKFNAQARQSGREYVSGETHFYLGRRYRLNVAERSGHGSVIVRNGSWIDLFVRDGSGFRDRERIFLTWYRKELRQLAAPLIRKRANDLGVPLPAWQIKRMKTKWGGSNIEACRIWLNLELIKKPQHCLEYIILHELVHFLERRHDDRFVGLMNNKMPLWRTYRDELNATPLGYEKWVTG